MYVAAGIVLASLASPAGAQGRSGPISNTVRLLGIPEVQKELKLTPAQNEQLAKVHSSLKPRLLEALRGMKGVPPAERQKKFGAFRDGMDRQVVELLDPSQRKRLRELELQQEGARVIAQPSFGAELRLLPDQTAKVNQAISSESRVLRALYGEAGKKDPLSKEDRAKLDAQVAETRKRTELELLKVLTSDQRTRYKVMQGAPFTFPAPTVRAVKPPVVAPSGKPAVKPVAKPGAKPVAKPRTPKK